VPTLGLILRAAEAALRRRPPWYVAPALEARRADGLWARRDLGLALSCAAVLSLSACGGGERQDEDEPEGDYRVEVVSATFPARQQLAKRSDLEIRVRNADDETIPNIALTVDGFDSRQDDPDLADPERPVFVVNGRPKDIGGFPEAKEQAPPGCETAYVSTWACGKLRPGEEKVFKWSITAVKAGAFKLKYTVAAGLDGKARALDVDGGGRPTGVITGSISDTPPDTRVADDGKTVIRGTR
jgi:hypothetical protein